MVRNNDAIKIEQLRVTDKDRALLDRLKREQERTKIYEEKQEMKRERKRIKEKIKEQKRKRSITYKVYTKIADKLKQLKERIL